MKIFSPKLIGTVRSSNTTIVDNLSGSFSGSFSPSESIIPSETDTFDLGSSDKRWKDLYLSGSTIFLGEIVIKDEQGNLSIRRSNGSQIQIEGSAASASFVEFGNIGNKPTLVSGSSQISFMNISDKPALISGSVDTSLISSETVLAIATENNGFLIESIEFGTTISGSLIINTTSTFDPVDIQEFNVTNDGSGAYLINEQSNPTLTLVRGETYTFNINAVGHPFWIKTEQTTGTDDAYNNGVTNNGTEDGTITFAVSNDAPDTLYYNCQFHSSMAGTINIVDSLNEITETTNVSIIGDAQITGSLHVTENVSAESFSGSFTGSFKSTENIIPSQTDTFDLGSSDKRWRDLYLSGSSIFLGNLILQEEEGKLQINDDQGNSVDLEGTAQTASFVEFGNIGNKPTLVSGSSQINISNTNGFSDFSSSVSTSLNELDVDVEFNNILNKPTLVSESSQVSFTDISDKPTLVSGSSQVSFTDISDKPTLISGSEQISFTDISDKPTLISGSSQVSFTDISDKPTLVSGSEQVSFTDISDKPTLVSGSSQVSFIDISDKPTLVSGSEQIDISDISGDTFPSRSFTFLDNLTVTGNLSILGTQFVSNTETLQIADNLLILNDGEEGAGVTAGIAGIEIDRGSETDYQFVFNETTDDFEVGEVGDLQSVATRQTSPTSAGIPFWNNSQKRFDNSSNATLDSSGNIVANSVTGSLSGNATTATTLQTARTIGGVSFNGSENINLPGVNTIGNQDTTGSSATLTTARTITIGSTGKTFDGSANVAWALGEIGVNNNTLTLSTSGIATGSQTWTSNQGSNATFTVNVPATNLGITAGTTAGPIVTSSTGTNATLPTASGTASGVVTTGAQTWAGTKTFSSTIAGSITGNAATATALTSGNKTISGNLTVSGTVTATELIETSTITLKENINPIDDALSTITKLSGVTYNRKGTTDNEAGLIAEWVYDILPDLVTKDENDEIVGLKYTKLIAYLIEAIKTLKSELDEIKR